MKKFDLFMLGVAVGILLILLMVLIFGEVTIV